MISLGLSTRLKAVQEQGEQDREEYNWVDLGRVCYGLRNDEGEVHVHMKIGVIKYKKKGNPVEIVDVIEKYYGSTYGINNYTPHKIEKVLYHKPSNLDRLIRKMQGEDTRTHKN